MSRMVADVDMGAGRENGNGQESQCSSEDDAEVPAKVPSRGIRRHERPVVVVRRMARSRCSGVLPRSRYHGHGLVVVVVVVRAKEEKKRKRAANEWIRQTCEENSGSHHPGPQQVEEGEGRVREGRYNLSWWRQRLPCSSLPAPKSGRLWGYDAEAGRYDRKGPLSSENSPCPVDGGKEMNDGGRRRARVEESSRWLRPGNRSVHQGGPKRASTG
jgi:hypothetical protein